MRANANAMPGIVLAATKKLMGVALTLPVSGNLAGAQSAGPQHCAQVLDDLPLQGGAVAALKPPASILCRGRASRLDAVSPEATRSAPGLSMAISLCDRL